MLAADDTGLPNPAGLITGMPTSPSRNLYFQAREEFADISYRALALLAHSRKVAEELAQSAMRSTRLLLDLGAVLDEFHIRPLEIALEHAVGRPWRKAYNKATAECPDWQPLPQIGWGSRAEPGAGSDKGHV